MTSTIVCSDDIRPTLTIDQDVAVQLETIRHDQNVPLKQIVNDALRQGLKAMNNQSKSQKKFRTKTVSLGACLAGGLDNVAE
ncbi:hypothetical protein OAM01_02875, partial [bacterium]|nr:hypothetical protein [bacterium]